MRPAMWWAGSALLVGCASAPTTSAQPPRAIAGPAALAMVPMGYPLDTLGPSWVPPGFGSLRQEDIAIRVEPTSGLQVRAVPLDERFTRLLSPDGYRSLHDLLIARGKALNAIRDRTRLPAYSVWYVSFFTLELGETRFAPNDFIINNGGRDFRPLDMVALTPGFGDYRVKQREVQSALLVFDGQLDLNQPLTATMESTASTTDWNSVLQKVERERTLVRSRAQAAKP